MSYGSCRMIYENFSSGTLTKDAYLKQREEIDSKLAAAKVEQEAQEPFSVNSFPFGQSLASSALLLVHR